VRKSLIFCLLIAAVGLAAYSNTFHVPFQFDDSEQITDNEVIRDLDNFFLSSSGYKFNPRRFVGYITFALNYHFGGLDVTGYHIVNLAIHIVNGILVYLLVLITFRTPFFSRSHPHPNPPPSRGRGQKEGSPSSSEKTPEENSPPLRGGDKGEGASRFTIHYSRSLIALFSALLFVAHPVQTQAVTYIVQRLTSLATMFYLLSVITYIKGRLAAGKAIGDGQEAMGKRQDEQSLFAVSSVSIAYRLSPIAFFILSLLFAVCAMKTKEMTFTLPAVIVLCEFGFFRATLKKKLLFLIPVLLTLAVIPLSILGTHRPLGEILSDLSEKTRVQTDIARWDYLMTQMRVITTYIRLIFFPVDQNLDYDYPIYRSLLDPAVAASFMFLATLIGAAGYLLYKSRRNQADKLTSEQADRLKTSLPIAYRLSPIALLYRLVSFGIFWFFITLAVESSLIPIADVIFEHRIYLPSVGAFIAITTSVFIIAERLRSRWRSVEKAAMVILSVIVVVFAGTAYARNDVWRDKVSLWEDVVKKSPQKSRPHNDLGYLYLEKGMTDRAIEQFRIALQLNPLNADAYNNLGVAYHDKGRFDLSVMQFRTALSLASSKSELADSHHNIGIAYARAGMLTDALREMKAALENDPKNPEIYSDMGFVYKGMGNTDKAIESYRMALSLKSDYAPAHFNLGMIYKETGMAEKATEHLGKAHNLDPQRF
jgi:tetratricopeptide (TPR) repeat protein